MVKTQEEAGEILQHLKQGKSFAELALNHSIDKNTAALGGDFGYFKKGDLQPELEQAVLKLKKNETSEAVKTALGFHIFERLKSGWKNEGRDVRRAEGNVLFTLLAYC